MLLRVAGANGSWGTAAGVYVGRDQADAYFVTVLHAVQNSATGAITSQVQVQFFDTATQFPGHTFSQYDASKDLAVISVPVVDLPASMVKISPKDPQAGMQIHAIGHPPAGPWTTWAGSVENDVAVAGSPEKFSATADPSLTHGFSGGPIFDNDGNFIGIHLSAGDSFSTNLKSSVILTTLQAWNVPTTNLVSADVDTRRFDISREIVACLRSDDMDCVKGYLATAVRDQLSNQQIRMSWSAPMGFLGNFVGISGQMKRVVGGVTLYVTRMKFDRGNFELRLMFDSSDSVVGIWLITTGDHNSQELESKAKTVVQQLAQGQFQDVYNEFTPSVRAGKSVDVVSGAWNTWLMSTGSFMQVVSAEKSSEFDVVDVRCQFAKGPAAVRISFTPMMELIEINMVPIYPGQ